MMRRSTQTSQWPHTPVSNARCPHCIGMILPIYFKKTSDSSAAFERVLRLVPMVVDNSEREYVASAILALVDESLDERQRLKLRKEFIKMFKLVEELYEDGREEGREEGEHMKAIQIAEKMFRRGASVSDVIELTGISEEEARQVRRQVHNA